VTEIMQQPLQGRRPAAVVLASASRARAAMLVQAGVGCTPHPANVDEDEVKRSLRATGTDVAGVAQALAVLKAENTSRRHPGALVIGADQMLDCDGVWFDKPTGRDGARSTLYALRGRDHRLISAAVVVCDGVRVWQHTDDAVLTMRRLTDEYVERYLDAVGEAAWSSVGAYQLEGLGAQLFQRVEGDFFTVLGLPLLPLLDFLRTRGVLAE
jgi:septum formation protein